MNEIKTQGNFMSYGPEGEQRAAFALESDKWLFEAARDLLLACKLIEPAIDSLLTEFISKTRATDWRLVNDCLCQVRNALVRAKGGT